jgi:hypothetical protein
MAVSFFDPEPRFVSDEAIRCSLREEGLLEGDIDRYVDYLTDNPDIWIMFQTKALELIDMGQEHYGAGAIVEIIRYERIRRGADGFTINNNVRAALARMFQIAFPEFKSFFATRKMKGTKGI